MTNAFCMDNINITVLGRTQMHGNDCALDDKVF